MHWVGVIGCQPNDAMTAFLVQQLTAMHVITGRGAADEEVHVENAVESRSVLNPAITHSYLGHLFSLADTKWTVS